jgi:membrane fusion protein (multidrug efflux system)
MVDGFQKLRGGAPVNAVPWQPGVAASAVAGTSAQTSGAASAPKSASSPAGGS